MGRRWIAGMAGVLVALVLGGCGPRSSEAQWARVTALTCRSTIARAHLADPRPAQITPERFLAERRRLLESHRGFNTVTAFRNVCSKIRQEILQETTPPATSPIPAFNPTWIVPTSAAP